MALSHCSYHQQPNLCLTRREEQWSNLSLFGYLLHSAVFASTRRDMHILQDVSLLHLDEPDLRLFSPVMQPLVSAMTTLRQAFAAALKSLLRGKSFIQAFLAFWVGPNVAKGQKVDTRDPPRRTIEEFLKEAQALLVGPSEGDGLKEFASKLKLRFREGLMSNPDCMLPSYNDQLPNGYERGQYLALDVGGSTLRVALVELRSRGARGSESGIIRMKSFPINRAIKDLEGMEFFNWMADLILETVAEDVKQNSSEKPLPMGLAWSFPIEYVPLFSPVPRPS